MSWWRRSGGGRRAWGPTAAPATSTAARLTVEPARIVVPPTPVQEPWGAVRLVFDDGSAVALDAHDPRSRAFRALADALLDRRTHLPAQDRPPLADPHEESDTRTAPGERGLG